MTPDRPGSMRITIRSRFAFSTADELRSGISSAKDLTLKIAPGTTIEALLRRFPSLGSPGTDDDMMLHVFVGGRLQGLDDVLQPGDVLDLHIPVSGG